MVSAWCGAGWQLSPTEINFRIRAKQGKGSGSSRKFPFEIKHVYPKIHKITLRLAVPNRIPYRGAYDFGLRRGSQPSLFRLYVPSGLGHEIGERLTGQGNWVIFLLPGVALESRAKEGH